MRPKYISSPSYRRRQLVAKAVIEWALAIVVLASICTVFLAIARLVLGDR